MNRACVPRATSDHGVTAHIIHRSLGYVGPGAEARCAMARWWCARASIEETPRNNRCQQPASRQLEAWWDATELSMARNRRDIRLQNGARTP